MREKPILFGDSMVHAILAGNKIHTRRLWKMPRWAQFDPVADGESKGIIIPKNPADRAWYDVEEIASPYGREGDQLWVREAWYCDHFQVQKGPYLEVPGAKDVLYYRATDCDLNGSTYTGFAGETMRNPWRPSIHMPRWASRLQLEIVSVHVERLQDITMEDAVKEGIDWKLCQQLTTTAPSRHKLLPAAVHAYAHLWDLLNGDGSWDLNPLVWVIEFEVIKP